MAEGNIIQFPGCIYKETEARIVLDEAIASQLDCALILGITPEGDLYADCSTGDVPEILWLIETFKHHLLAGDYSE